MSAIANRLSLVVATIALLFCVHLVTSTASPTSRDNFNVPCKFRDSLNISGGHFDAATKTIQYGNTTYYPGQYGTYDYEFIYDQRRPAERHYRACVCENKPCIRLCCPLGESYYSFNESFVCKPNQHHNLHELRVQMLDLDLNETVDSNALDKFGYVVGTPCDTYALAPEDPMNADTDAWQMLTV